MATAATIAGAIGAKTAQFISAKALSRSLAVVMMLSVPLILTRDTNSTYKPSVRDGVQLLLTQLDEFISPGFVKAASRIQSYMLENSHLVMIGLITGFASGTLGELVLFMCLMLPIETILTLPKRHRWGYCYDNLFG